MKLAICKAPYLESNKCIIIIIILQEESPACMEAGIAEWAAWTAEKQSTLSGRWKAGWGFSVSPIISEQVSGMTQQVLGGTMCSQHSTQT